MRDNLIHIFDGEKFVSQAKHGTLNQLMDNHMVSIEESLENSREKLNSKTIDIIEKLIEKINDETTQIICPENLSKSTKPIKKKRIIKNNFKSDVISEKVKFII